MPELPEVETVVRDLRPLLVGRTISGVRTSKHSLRKRWSKSWNKQLIGQHVEAIERRGKWIVVSLGHGGSLILHLGMTGQLRVHPAEEACADHTHLVFALDDGENELRFRDIRRFGSATLLADRESVQEFFAAAQLGPEPFVLEQEVWHRELLSTRRCLKAVLLDQRVVAGVGNIYADESLFEAGLHPTRLGCQLSAAETARLREAIVIVLTRAIAKRGSSIRNYVGGSGLLGGYQREFRVYGQDGEPCPRCREPIALIRLAGRATHFCPRCQMTPTKGSRSKSAVRRRDKVSR